jgi:hypothetical protein
MKLKNTKSIFRGKPIGIYVFSFAQQLFGIFKEINVLIESIYNQNYLLKKPLLKIKNGRHNQRSRQHNFVRPPPLRKNKIKFFLFRRGPISGHIS